MAKNKPPKWPFVSTTMSRTGIWFETLVTVKRGSRFFDFQLMDRYEVRGAKKKETAMKYFTDKAVFTFKRYNPSGTGSIPFAVSDEEEESDMSQEPIFLAHAK